MERWQDLLADIEAQAEAQEAMERSGEAAEHARVETARSRLDERLLAALGQPVQVVLGAAGPLRGVLVAVGPDWALLVDAGANHEHLVPIAAITVITGLTRALRAPDASPVHDRLDLAWALRRLSRDRAVVRVRTRDGQGFGGVLDAVGSDHLDVVDDLLGGGPDGSARLTTVPLAAVAVVTRS